MQQLLESIKSLQEAWSKGLFERHVGCVEYHIVFDGAVSGIVPEKFPLQLVSLMQQVFGKVLLFGQSMYERYFTAIK